MWSGWKDGRETTGKQGSREWERAVLCYGLPISALLRNQDFIPRALFASGFSIDMLEVLWRIKKLEGEEKDEVKDCFRDKFPKVGREARARERSKMIPVS